MLQERAIPFGEWLPDLAALGNPGMPKGSTNFSGHEGFHSSRKVLKPFTDALPSIPRGAIWGQSSAGDVSFIVGLADGARFLKSDFTWSDITPDGNITGIKKWEFVSFGDRVIAATGKTRLLQISIPPKVGGKFEEIPNSPQASRLGVIRDFVVAGDIAGTPSMVHWSGFNNAELWESSQSTQSDSQEIHGFGGRVHKIVSGEYGVIFQANSIRLMTYVGPRVIFRIDVKGRGRGTPAPESVCWIDDKIYYYGHDDFYMFDGMRSEPLGANRIRKWFQEYISGGRPDSIQGVVDRHNARVLWGFRQVGDGDLNTHILEYNYAADKWSLAEDGNSTLVEYASTAITPDDTAHGGESFDTPSTPNFWYGKSLDSSLFQGGSINLIGFDSEHKAADFSGESLHSELVTKEVTGPGGLSMYVNAVRPLISGVANNKEIRVSIGYRDREDKDDDGKDVKWTTPVFLTRKGFAPIRVRARFIRVRVYIGTGGFDQAQGVIIYLKKAGS